MGDGTIGYIYRKLCNTPSDINEHLPVLMKLAANSTSIVEMGVREAVSSWAFMEGLINNGSGIKTLISVDINDVPDIEYIAYQATKAAIDFKFIKHDSVTVDIPEVDVLFIDTWHVYGHLKRELDAHHTKAKKFIVLHDTESYKTESETAYFKGDVEGECKRSGYSAEEVTKGIGFAVVDFLAEQPGWVIGLHFQNNNGLTF